MADAVSVKLPSRLKEEIDELIQQGVFVSRSDALRFGARMAVAIERDALPLSSRAESLAAQEIRKKFERIRRDVR